ncbi:MAG: PQQ-dependent sugar dehydrogenase [Wenzhouxiangellaceae bacterium]
MVICSVSVQAGGVVVPPDVSLDSFISGLSLPLAARHAGDGSGRLFIVEQDGLIRIWDGTQVLATPFIDLTNVTNASGERGLLGLDFHPDYANNGRFYVNFTADGLAGVTNGTTVIAEYTVSGNPNVADAGSRRILMTIRQDFSNHNGGDLHFGPDGFLYIGMGDGGSGNDPCNRGQTLDPNNIVVGGGCVNDPTVALLGKMLRIDVDGTTPAGSNELCAAAGDGSAEYAIPPGNPFAGADNACDEVWAYGIRNPFRFSFDRDTGDLWIGDVGQNWWEEINLEPAGSAGGINYGWNPCEGTHPRGNSNPGSVCSFASQFPVFEYRHDNGNCSVAGGYRYRGPVDSLNGTYVFGDFCTGTIWFGQETAPDVFESAVSGFTTSNLSAFGEDEDGEVFAISLGGGQIFRFNGDRSDIIFADGFEEAI